MDIEKLKPCKVFVPAVWDLEFFASRAGSPHRETAVSALHRIPNPTGVAWFTACESAGRTSRSMHLWS